MSDTLQIFKNFAFFEDAQIISLPYFANSYCFHFEKMQRNSSPSYSSPCIIIMVLSKYFFISKFTILWKVPYGDEEKGLYVTIEACKDPKAPKPRAGGNAWVSAGLGLGLLGLAMH